jgi:hypothetical protein
MDVATLMINLVFFLISLVLQYSSIIVAGLPQQLVSKPVYDVRDFLYKIRHDQVWRIRQFQIMAEEGEGSFSVIRHGEGVIRKKNQKAWTI